MFDRVIHREFSNVGFQGRRRFPGVPVKPAALRRYLSPRSALRLDLNAGDILSVQAHGGEAPATVTAFDERGKPALGRLGLSANASVTLTDFDSAELIGWATGQGGDIGQTIAAAKHGIEDLLVLTAQSACTAWVLMPIAVQNLVTGGGHGVLEVSVKTASRGSHRDLPLPLGEIREEFTVSKGTASAYQVEPGEFIQIIDVEGQQCSDFTALRHQPLESGHELAVDGTVTRSMVRGAYPGPGLLDKFYDGDLGPMLRVVQDTCGRHDTFGVACTARGYEDRGFPGHLNCSDNISEVLEPFGVKRRAAWPAVNFFWNTWVDAHSHQLMTEESYSRPGDYVVMQALDRLVCASTACPDDIDPINGWNPTDVHVRIYRPESTIRRAVAYRDKEDAPMSISEESAFHPATSKLTTQFAPARDVWTPVAFPAIGTTGEYWACRERVTLQDMSSLRKYDIIGPDAERLLQHALTKNIAKLATWRGTYALMCDATGTVIDDGTLFRMAPDLFRWCCGTEESARSLQALAENQGYQVRIHGMGSALPNLALQGPRSRDVLRKLVFTQPAMPSLNELKWFGATVARVGDRDGIPFMLTRSGYTGELGYELFCAASDATALWNAVMSAGEEFGIAPMGAAALETIRIEAGLAAANAEFAPGSDAFEAGLGFAVDLKKTGFVGKDALARNAKDPRRVLMGLMFECDDVPLRGAHVFLGERPVGTITSATRSPMFERTIAMARVHVEFSTPGMKLEVGQMDGHMKRLPATVCEIPFFDPKRERARA
ncbi:MAG: DUF1989 domain-containing protein [Pseudomonadota bacterium]